MDGEAAGGCLCGAVRYTARGPLRDVVVCHCGRCRRQHGHAGAYTEVAAADLELSGEVAWYAADGRERGFCPVCGSSLFWRRAGDERVSVAAGTLDAPTGLRTVAHIHVASRGDYYELADGLEQFPAGRMADHDRAAWEERWTRAVREHGDRVAQMPPNAHLTDAVAGLPPGRALDAGCGHGAEALWLAARGWRVTAVDFSATALAQARSADVEGRVEWVEADLGTWAPEPDAYDLVGSLYVHVAGPVEAFVRRMAAGVAPGGTLFLVGHGPVDPATGAPTAAASQVQVSVAAATAVLDPGRWELLVAEERPRAAAGTGVDAVIRARRTGAR